jgi:exonuclease SbcC
LLNRLHIKNCFKHKDAVFEFAEGLTAITGPNESGKSLLLEMIRFALFGVDATRGSSPDYKDTYVALDFVVNGETYRVERSRRPKLTNAVGEELAVGTTPVNAKVREIFGYDLLVFDVANACNQGEVEALSNMKPSERKRMVDQTIGLNALDDIIKWLTDDISTVSNTIDFLQKKVIAPERPVPPDDPRPASVLRDAANKTHALVRERSEIVGFLSSAQTAPTLPDPPDVDLDLDTMEEAQEERQRVLKQIQPLQIKVGQYVAPKYTSEGLVTMRRENEDYRQRLRYEDLLRHKKTECPSCGHQWGPFDDELATLERFADAPKPLATIAQIEIEEQRIAARPEIDMAKVALHDLQAQLDAMPDHTRSIAQVEAYQKALKAYDIAKGRYDQWVALVDQKKTRLAELNGVDEEYTRLLALHAEAKQYETAIARYEIDLAKYEAEQVELDEKIFELEQLRAARKAMHDVKIKVKTYLIPSLNKVASGLLSQMTGGDRNTIAIQEDFDILVDGQPINTLSGSGKAIANLALRIGLGQVLTNSVFSVFLADEIDAAMDERRAALTSKCLSRLTQSVKQVVLVSHKRPEADHFIELTG